MCYLGNELFVEKVRKTYPRGTRIKLISMDDPRAIPSGSFGTVDHVDDAGQIHMVWDCGRSLALIPGEDRFCIAKEDEGK